MQSGTRRTHAAVQLSDALAGTLGDTVKSFDDVAQRAQQIARVGTPTHPTATSRTSTPGICRYSPAVCCKERRPDGFTVSTQKPVEVSPGKTDQPDPLLMVGALRPDMDEKFERKVGNHLRCGLGALDTPGGGRKLRPRPQRHPSAGRRPVCITAPSGTGRGNVVSWKRTSSPHS